VPVATDIAFALGILALIGRSLPKEIKILLLSIAIIDDVAAIVIIALFYTDNLSVTALSLGSLGLISAIGLNVMGVKRIAPYIMIGIFMWVCVLKSGVHATLAGVVLAMCIPMTGEKNDCPVEELEHALHPWVFFGIMPLFAFANAGVNLSGFSMDMVTASIPLGIILGLFVGKQLGVFAFIWAGVKSGLCQRPASLSWAHIYGMSILTGIGFTMSLFIGTLAYDNSETLSQVRLGVLVASFLSALVGFVVLKLTSKIK
jgi:NhaA family Na+:H+ antiporter